MTSKKAITRAELRVCSLSIRYALSASPDNWSRLEAAQAELAQLRAEQRGKQGVESQPKAV